LSIERNPAGEKMKKYLWLCVAVLLCGCAGMQKQKTATVELEGNPTTGFSWVYTISPEGVLREVTNKYMAHKADKGMAGSGGKFIFVFKAAAAGEAELVFSYRRVWEEGIPALKTVNYRVNVDGRKNLKLLPE